MEKLFWQNFYQASSSCFQVAVEEGGWRSSSSLKLRVGVQSSEMRITCNVLNNYFKDMIQVVQNLRKQIYQQPEVFFFFLL